MKRLATVDSVLDLDPDPYGFLFRLPWVYIEGSEMCVCRKRKSEDVAPPDSDLQRGRTREYHVPLEFERLSLLHRLQFRCWPELRTSAESMA